MGTTGVLRLQPGIPTAVAGRAELVADLRHARAAPLAGMLEETRAAAGEAAAAHDCSVSESEVWHIEPIPFDARLVAAALEAAGTAHELVIYEGDEHQLVLHRQEWIARVVDWFRAH